MIINIPIEVTLEDFEAVIITALEGGSNYWYYIPDQDEPPVIEGKTYDESIAHALYNDLNYALLINYVENPDEQLGIVNHQSMIDAFSNKKHLYSVVNIIKGDYDAEDADILFQLATLGELTFG